MAIIKVKATSPGRRGLEKVVTPGLHKGKPFSPLLQKKIRGSGRNSSGRITVRHQGGGHKQFVRLIDFKRNKDGIPAKVATIEYDPNRSANIALLHYSDGEKRYILSPFGLRVGDSLLSGEEAPLRIGNCLLLKDVPTGLFVHNVELEPGRGGQMVRSAGAAAQVMAHEKEFTTLKLPSSEIRMVRSNCRATVGEVGNKSHEQIVSGKAGRSRWLGRRPKVRGVAMNPVDHPMGGGEGKSSGGRHPTTPWGKPTKGYKTRNKKKKSNVYIVNRRK